MRYRKEKMSAEFTKHFIDIGDSQFILHHFTGADKGGPHDHPFDIDSTIEYGSCLERIYEIIDGKVHIEDVLHKKGDRRIIKAECIHEIIGLPDGELWTSVEYKEKVREPGFWRFDDRGIWFRQWNRRWRKYQ